MWIRNEWGLWRKSRFAKYFHNLGIFHPDDMSDIILTSYGRFLHHQDIRLDEQIAFCQTYWRSQPVRRQP